MSDGSENEIKLISIQKTYTTKSLTKEIKAKRKRLRSSDKTAKQRKIENADPYFNSEPVNCGVEPATNDWTTRTKIQLTNMFTLKITNETKDANSSKFQSTALPIPNRSRLGNVNLISLWVRACASANIPI